MQRASLEARQQDIRDKQLAVQQSAEYVEKLKVCAVPCGAGKGVELGRAKGEGRANFRQWQNVTWQA